MDIQQLKSLLLKEHARDKKLTIINFALILTLLVVIIGLVLYFAPSIAQLLDVALNITQGENGWYFALAFSVLILGGIIYVINKLVKLNKRPAKIDEFLSKIENGRRAASVDEYVEYRIVIPLGKITFKLCPVNYTMVVFEGDILFYKLPLEKAYVPDFKTVLSGANLAAVSKAKDELYSESSGVAKVDNSNVEQDETAAITPMKTVEDFRKFIDEELSDTINDLEKSRKGGRKTMYIFGAISILCALGFMAYMMRNAFAGGESGTYTSFSPTMYYPIIVIIALSAGVYYIFVRPKQVKAMKSGQPMIGSTDGFSFKTKVFEKILKFASSETQYVMHGHVGLEEFIESGMFRKISYDVTGNDLVIGKHSGVPFQFCDLTVSHQKQFRKENEGPDCALYGQFFVARFNKSFSTPIYIVPRGGVKDFFFNNEINEYAVTPGEKIELEDPEFMKMFRVYGADQIEARYILTTSLMERIKNLALRTKGQYYISFYNNRITVANNSGKNNFEMSASKSITKKENQVLVDFYQDICDQFAIIDELKLNIKIWR